jgi:outer membrane receptor protein involved in Fe transport
MDARARQERRKGKGIGSLAVALALALFHPAAWAVEPKIPFNIPAGELAETVLEFYRQSGLEILYYSTNSVAGVKTQAVSGELEPTVALARMLEGTGFTFEFENALSVLLRRKDGPSGSAALGDEMASTGMGHASGSPASPGSSEVGPKMAEVVVTGSYLHGVLDIMSPLVTVDREQMKATPYATVQDALQTLPFNMLSGQDENFGGVGNFNRGSAPNLRGLGYGATLVLVNGRRQPAAGTEADFVDLSNIPWSMVDHIDVLPDGASALYGSDAVAGVVNIILRDRLRGAETKFRAGLTPGGAEEKLAAQLFGNEWDTGHWLLAYQYSSRSSLAAKDRTYTANADKRPLGGSDFRSFRSNPGNILDPGTFAPALAIPPNQDGSSLTPSDLLPSTVNLQNQFATFDLGPERRMHGAFLTGSQKLNESVELFAEGRYSYRSTQYRGLRFERPLLVPNSNPFFIDPFGGMPFVFVAYDLSRDLGPPNYTSQTRSQFNTLGMKTHFANDWRATLSASYGKEDLYFLGSNLVDQTALDEALADPNSMTAFNPFGDGSQTNSATLNAIRSMQKERSTSTIASTGLVADGRLFDLPAGAVKLATGFEHRKESLDRDRSIHQRFDRDVDSAFAETSLPMLGNAGDPRAIPRLEISLAGRYEKYSDFGDTFNPKLGLRWAPLKWMKLRTSWGRSFKAPNFIDLYDTSNNLAFLVALPDPQSAAGQSIVLGIQGTNPNLIEETATTRTIGLDLAPEIIPEFTLSLTYFDTDYENQIIQPGPPSPFDILIQEDIWAGVIKRNPSLVEIAAVCHRSDFFGSASQCLASYPAAIVDIRLRNLTGVRTQGFDLQVNKRIQTLYGDFHFYLNSTYVLDFKRSITKTSPAVDSLDTFGNPLALKIKSAIQWHQYGKNQPGFFANATVNYTGSYQDTESTLHRKVDAWMPIDLQIGYRTPASDHWSGSLEFRLNAINIFGANPPFADRTSGYDIFNAVPYGRVVSLFVDKGW